MCNALEPLSKKFMHGWINWQYNKAIRAINSTMSWSNQLASAIGWLSHSDITVQVTSCMFGGTNRIVYAFQRSQETSYALVKYCLGLTEKHATLRTCELQNMNMVCVDVSHEGENMGRRSLNCRLASPSTCNHDWQGRKGMSSIEMLSHVWFGI
jgi:hypothetical protein